MQPLSDPSIPDQIGSATVAADQTGVRIGTVTSFDQFGSITVAISGSNVLTQATYLSSYVPSAGDQVAIIKYGASWLVLGTMGQTQSRLTPVVAYEGTNGNISLPSATYGDLDPPANPGPSITLNIGSSGRALILMQCDLPGARGTVGYVGGRASVVLSGANVDSAHDRFSFGWSNWQYNTGANFVGWNGTFSKIWTGLNPGLTTWTMKYMRYDNASTLAAQERSIMGWAY